MSISSLRYAPPSLQRSGHSPVQQALKDLKTNLPHVSDLVQQARQSTTNEDYYRVKGTLDRAYANILAWVDVFESHRKRIPNDLLQAINTLERDIPELKPPKDD
jgi:hypothetical protein